jgi:hypothetical protein
VWGCSASPTEGARGNVLPNVRTSFNPRIHLPKLEREDFISPLASVIGAVELGEDVLVAPLASIRG